MRMNGVMTKPKIVRCGCGKKFPSQSALAMHQSATKHPPVLGKDQAVQQEAKRTWFQALLQKFSRKS